MSQDIGRYCSYSPGRGEDRDLIYEQIKTQWGSQLQGLTKLDKLSAIAILTRTLVWLEILGRDQYGVADEIDSYGLKLSDEGEKFLLLAAKLPQSEYLSLCEALVNQLKYGRHK